MGGWAASGTCAGMVPHSEGTGVKEGPGGKGQNMELRHSKARCFIYPKRIPDERGIRSNGICMLRLTTIHVTTPYTVPQTHHHHVHMLSRRTFQREEGSEASDGNETFGVGENPVGPKSPPASQNAFTSSSVGTGRTFDTTASDHSVVEACGTVVLL